MLRGLKNSLTLGKLETHSRWGRKLMKKLVALRRLLGIPGKGVKAKRDSRRGIGTESLFEIWKKGGRGWRGKGKKRRVGEAGLC